MSELISGKDALIAWAKNKEVEYMLLNKWNLLGGSTPLSIFDRDDVKFRLKPRTILINGIEVPAPFEPKDEDRFYFLCSRIGKGYDLAEKINSNCVADQFGAWRTEEEIKQVVAALRRVLGGSHDN